MTRLLLIAALTLPAAAQTLRVDESHTTLTFLTTHFLAELPITNTAHLTTATISLDLLDPTDTLRSHATTTCTLPTATTTCTIPLPPAAPEHQANEDIAPFRLRYTIKTPSQPPLTGTLALDHIAPTLYILHAATPEKVRPGSPYTVRIRATHPLTHTPQPNIPLTATVTADINTQTEEVTTKNLTTDRNGFATLEFITPTNPALDSITIAIEGRLTNLHTRIQQDINVPNQKSLALTTDKPLYQPGQTAHLRLLAIDRHGHARPTTRLKIDIRDPDSTLIFRTEATTSHFGIASADWTIPARLRLGNYTIAVQPDNDTDDTGDDAPASAEIRISRYDLPTFTVNPKPDKPFYLPNQNASVEVRATYLFGKPVLHGHVRVVRETEREWNFEKQKYDTNEAAVYSGDLDNTGAFTAHVDLSADEKNIRDNSDPNHFEDLHLAAYVTDASTGRTEQRRFDLRITPNPLHIRFIRDAIYPAALPIGFTLSVETADGLPVPDATARIALLPASNDPNETLTQRAPHAVELTEVHTNAYGLARVDNLPLYADLLKRMPPPVSQRNPLSTAYQPWQNNDTPHFDLLATARTPDGRTGLSTERFDEPSAPIRLTTDHSLYKPGDPIQVTLTSAEPDLPIHLQLLRETRSGLLTLATENLTLHNGRATATLSSGTDEKPDPRFTGYLTIAAVALGSEKTTRTSWGYSDESPAAAFTTVLFPRDNSLHVDVKLNRDTYRPGDTATATVNVKGPQDSDGEDFSPARTALGIVAIDQAVSERNRSDNDFGNQPSFFFPWRMLFNNGNEVAGLSLLDLEQRDPNKPFTPDLDLAAAALLNNSRTALNLANNRNNQGLGSIFAGLLDAQLDPTRKDLEIYLKGHLDAPTTLPELDALLAPRDLSTLHDPWGQPYRLNTSIFYGQLNLELLSSGSDKLPNTADDFLIPLARWNWFARHESDLRRVLIDHHQRTGAFIRDLPTLTAAMQAEHIDIATWRDPWGNPFTWTFSIQQADLAVTAVTHGPPPTASNRGYSFPAGSASISWFTDDRLRIQTALNDYAKTHAFPTTQRELDAALQASKLSLADFKDPLGHPLYANFRTRSIFTDRVTVEARAHAGATPQKHTTVTPVTEMVDTIDLRSDGPDSTHGNQDDFTAASFSHIRSTQSAKETTPQKPTASPTQSGQPTIDTGAITGTITDQTGATIPNASIVATNTAIQAEFEIKSNEDGTYLLTPLPAGTYTLQVKFPGFQTTVIDQIHVLSPDATVLDVKLNVGAVSESVEVLAGSVSLSTESASIAGVAGGVFGGMTAGHLTANLERKAKASYGLMAPPPPPSPTTPRIREYFPETLLWRPEILTTDDGNASIRFTIADTITTWQLGVAASTLRGNTGGASTTFTTFLPFFAAFDPPQTLTVGDQIALPITLRNYLTHPVTVHSTLTPVTDQPRKTGVQGGFSPLSKPPIKPGFSPGPFLRIDTPPPTTTVPAADSASPITRITALAPTPSAKLLFTARPTGDPGDSIERPITIHPDGLEASTTTAGIITGPTTFDITIPSDALPNSTDATLKIYPNLAAHLRDALTAMDAYPQGCAEQIISTAWPSLLLQHYAATLPAPDKPLKTDTRLRLEAAYANLLSDRSIDGGFRYWSNDPRSDLALTAYAIEFLTAAKPWIAIDDTVLKNAVDYLAKQQAKSGLWIRVDRDNKPHPEDADGNAMLTTSIAAMISAAPNTQPLIQKALTATQPFTESIDEPYTLANYALAAIAIKDPRSTPAIARLRSLALSENGGAYWSLETNTPFFGWGTAGRVETTAAALRALLASGATSHDDLITRGLLFLDHSQDRHSLWYSTQATARTLDVLAAIALDTSPSNLRKSTLKPHLDTPNSARNPLTISIENHLIATANLPSPGKDTGPIYIPLGPNLTPGPHKITLNLPPNTSPATAQIVANYYRPWPIIQPASATTNNEQLRLSVAFDSLTNTTVHATAHIERLGFRGYGMLIAEIGLPPGADVDRASLTADHYEILPDRLLIYLWPQAGGNDLTFTFTQRYKTKALAAPSTLYDYYNPDARIDLPPQRFNSLD